MELNELMTGFAAESGIDGLVPDGDGIYHLGVDDMVISVAGSEGGGEVALLGELGELPPEGAEEFYRSMMEAMYQGKATGGAVFSLERASRRLCVHQREELARLDSVKFKSLLEKFADTVEEWRQKLLDFRPGVPTSAVAGDVPMSDMGMGGFMQV